MQESLLALPTAVGSPCPSRTLFTDSDSPIYDELVREWRHAGRTVPRKAGSAGWLRPEDEDPLASFGRV